VIFVVEYLREYGSVFETSLANESVDQGVLFDEKKQKSKISWDCPFNEIPSEKSLYSTQVAHFDTEI
jgi:hypothetical protein